MGVFSRLFRGSVQSDRSYVRSWAGKRWREARHSGVLPMEILCAALMYGLSSFGEEDMRGSCPRRAKGLGLDASEHYSGDAALFEVGCYMYFRLDLWLSKNRPNHRKEISTTFANEFIKLFTQALNSRDIQALFDQRISQYAELVRTGADLKTYHYHLSQLVLRTKDNQCSGAYDFETAPVMMTDAFEHFGVDIALAAWERGMIPACVKSVEDYCDLTEQQGITTSTWVQY